jgi:hypothetical protein
LAKGGPKPKPRPNPGPHAIATVATTARANAKLNPMMTTLFMEVHLLSFWILRTPALCREGQSFNSKKMIL